MAFDKIPKIEKYDFYPNVAFKRAQGLRGKSQKNKQLTKIETVSEFLVNSLEKILKNYPLIDNLDEFYKELFKSTMPYDQIKKSLGGVSWGIKMLKSLRKSYSIKIKKCEEEKKLNSLRTEYYGRARSVFKQLKEQLELLEEGRKTLKNFPAIKTGMETVCIFGFPNVGKTTLLYELTGSKPEIKPYAFTTKGINVSYLNKIQILDTPGTLNRDDKMNSIEIAAILAIKHLATAIIYVFDPTESYDMKDQIKLYNMIKNKNNNIYVYVSKTDMIKKHNLDKYNPINLEELKEKIKNM